MTMAKNSRSSFVELMEQGMGRKKHRVSAFTSVVRDNIMIEHRHSARRRGFVGSLAAAAANTAMSAVGANIHANTGSCCPMCPSLQTILNSNVPADEAFGGPFGKALESEVVGAPLTNLERDMLEQLAEEANLDGTAAARDPGIAAAARARAAASLAGKPIASRSQSLKQK